jgi:hypothetical protein
MFEHLGMDFEKIAAGEAASAATITLPAKATADAPTKSVQDGVTLYGPANEELMTINNIECDGDALVVKGQAYGTMPITLLLRPAQARRLLKMLGISWVPFLISLLFRRERPRTPK